MIESILGLIALGLVLAFFSHRQTQSYKHELIKLGMAKDRADELTKELASLTLQLEKYPVVLKTFLESQMDLTKLQEEDRQNLRNRLNAKKLENRQ